MSMAPLDRKILLGIIAAGIAIHLGGLAWGELAYRYFRYQCDTRAGEFISKSVENVAGIYQVRARDPADYFDRLSRGDPPEDPFGHTNTEAQEPWLPLVGGADSTQAYSYFETTVPPPEALQTLERFRFENDLQFTGDKYWIYRRAHQSPDDAAHNNITAKQAASVQSRYGFTWREVRGFWDHVFGVWGGELIALDLKTSEELGVLRGFILWATLSDRAGICPRHKSDKRFAFFIKKVLQPLPVAKP